MVNNLAPHFVDVHVGYKVRELRLRQDMTQQSLAAKVGVQFQQIQKYERGQNRISASRLYLIAHALGVSVGHFFDGLTDQPRTDVAQGVKIQPEALHETLQLVRLYHRLDTRLRSAIYAVIQTVAQSDDRVD